MDRPPPSQVVHARPPGSSQLPHAPSCLCFLDQFPPPVSPSSSTCSNSAHLQGVTQRLQFVGNPPNGSVLTTSQCLNWPHYDNYLELKVSICYFTKRLWLLMGERSHKLLFWCLAKAQSLGWEKCSHIQWKPTDFERPKSGKLKTYNAATDMEQKEFSITITENAKWYRCFIRQFSDFLQN